MTILRNILSGYSVNVTAQLPIVYAVTGACAMIYQLVWVRQICLIFGSEFTAVSVVTAVFFFGLALGGWLGGRLVTRTTNAVRMYAIVESCICLCALMVPVIMSLTESLYAAWYPDVIDNLRQVALIRLVLSACILLPATTFMGATVPLIIQAYSRRSSRLGSDVGLIYGMNALGGALGVMMAGYVLFQYVGLSGTNKIAVVLNAAMAFVAWWLSRSMEYSTSPASVKQVTPAVTQVRQKKFVLILTIYYACGFMYIGYELLWMRYFLLFFRDSIYLYAASIAAVILGVALGGSLSGRLVDRVSSQEKYLCLLIVAGALLHTLLIFELVQVHRIMFNLAVRSLSVETLFIFAVLLPPFTVMGGVFPVVTRILSKSHEVVGNRSSLVYSFNTIGCLTGALGTPFVLLPAIGVDGVVWLFLGCSLVAGGSVWLLPDDRVRILGWAWRAAGVCCILILPLVWLAQPQAGVVRNILERIKGPGDLVDVNQGILGTNWIVKPAGRDQAVLYENLVAFSRGGSPSFIIQGFIPLLIAPKGPQSVLGLCFGGGLTYYAQQLFDNIKKVDLVDISKSNIDMALKYLPINDGLMSDGRARFHIDDAYSYVKYTKSHYDLILIDSNPPFYSHNCAALYSQEFYRMCLDRLGQAGIFTQVLPLKQLKSDELRSIMCTFSSIFPHVMLWWNGLDPVMMGSRETFRLNVEQINQKLNCQNVGKALQLYSGDAKFDSLGHFLAGILLDDGGFRKVASQGKLNTTNKNYLEYTVDPVVDLNNIQILRDNLAPWRDVAALFNDAAVFDEYASQLEARRGYLLGLSQRQMMLNRIRF